MISLYVGFFLHVLELSPFVITNEMLQYRILLIKTLMLINFKHSHPSNGEGASCKDECKERNLNPPFYASHGSFMFFVVVLFPL